MQFDEIIAKARQLTYQGDYDLAIHLLSELNSKSPENPEVLIFLAEVYILSNKKEEAQKLIEKVENIEPDSPQLHRVLARFLLSEGKLEEALKAASHAVSKDNKDSRNYIVLAAVLCKKHEFDKAENFLNIALDLNSENPEAHYYKAVISNQSKQYAESIRILKNVLDDYPHLDKLWYLLCETYKSSNRSKFALEAIDKALKIKSDSPTYYLCKAEILPELNQNDEAIKILSYYVKNFGADAKSYTIFGFVYYKLKKYEESLKYLNAAIDINPDYIQAYSYKAQVLAEMKDLQKAVLCYQQIIKIKPDDVVILSEIGNLYSQMNKNEKAMTYFEKASKVDASLPRPYLYKSQHFIRNQEIKKASSTLKKALELPYKSPVAYAQLARIKAHEGNFLEALTLLDEAHQYFPGNQNTIMLYSDFVCCAPSDYPISKSFLGRVHLKLAALWNEYDNENLPNDEDVNKFVVDVLDTLRSFRILNLPMQKSQIFRGEIIGANCQQCKDLFDTKNVIPEICFGCYKVVLSFANLTDCIRYNFYMDKLDREVPIRRKLMIEGRYSNKGDMKGFYYTRDWEKAHRYCEHLKQVMAEKLKYDFSIKVKRGCSEFQDEHPEYNTLDENGNLVMECPDSWKEIEDEFFSRRNYEALIPSTKYDHLGLTIFDAFIIRNWVRMRKSYGFDDFQLEQPSQTKPGTI